MTEEQKEMHTQLEMMAQSFLYVSKQPLVKNPSDYGMEYEDLQFKTADGVNIAAWLIKGTKNKTIILSHPAAFTKYGYSIENEGPAKSGYTKDVEFLPAVKHLVDAGYSVLMYDQRNHGESGLDPNHGIHDPYKASLDNIAAIEFTATHAHLKGNEIGLYSICQSGLISTIGMHTQPEVYKKANVKAMVAPQMMSFEIFYKKFGVPEEGIKVLKNIYLEKGVDLDNQNPLRFVEHITVPTLFMQNINDPWTEIAHTKEIYNAIPGVKEAFWYEGENHRFDAYNWFNDHPEKLIAFFDTHLA